MNMNKFKNIRTIALILSFFAYANLLIPDVLRAEMIKSQLQTGHDIEMIREKLCSTQVLHEIRRFGLPENEALQIQNVITDTDVLKSLAYFGKEINSNEKGIVRADEKRLRKVADTLEQSAAKHTDENLRKKLSLRGRKLAEIKKESLIASELSTDKTGKTAQIRISEFQKAITSETLVSMGMNETDAGDVVSRLNNQDLKRIIQYDVKIEYGSGGHALGGLAEGFLWLFFILIFIIASIIAIFNGELIVIGIPVALVFLYVIANAIAS